MSDVKIHHYQLHNNHNFIVDENGFYVCDSCGLVLDEKPFSNKGTIAYTKDEKDKKYHHGDPISILSPSILMSSFIDLKEVTNPTLLNALRLNSQLNWKERNFKIAKIELSRIGSILNIPRFVLEDAMITYIKIFKKGKLRGRSIKSMVTASLFSSLKRYSIPISLVDLSKSSNISINKIKQSYFVIIKLISKRSSIITTQSIISRYFSELNVDNKFLSECIEILNLYNKKIGTSGKNIKGIVAGVIYFISQKYKLKLSQSKIAKSIGITEVTLRARKKELNKILKIMKF